jgi:LacI family transcriptional regulator
MAMILRRDSLAAQAAVILRAEIEAGTWTGMLPGELTLCRRLHISRATVRGALAKLEADGLVRGSKGRRREIVKVVPVRRAAVALSRVMVLSPVPHAGLTVTKLLWMDALRGELTSRGMAMELVVSAAVSLPRAHRVLKDLVGQHGDAVWILLRASGPVQKWFAGQGLPCAVAGSMVSGVALPAVDWDYFAACRHAAGRLLARGARRLGLVIPRSALPGDEESEAGFREGAGRHGVTVIRHDGTPDGLCRALDGAMGQSGAPDGLLVCHSTHTLTVLGRLQQQGFRVPADVRVVARDDDPMLLHAVPEPARYELPPERYAGQLARIVFQWVDGEVPAASTGRLLPSFVTGSSI